MNTVSEKPDFGSFKPDTLSDLLDAFSNPDRSGTLHISSKQGIGTITLSHGAIVFAFSFETSRRYARELVEADLLPERSVETFIALVRKGPFAEDEADILIQSGISPENLRRAVDMNNLSTLAYINTWEGVYRFYDEEFGEPPVHSPVDRNRLREILAESKKDRPNAANIDLSNVISRKLYDMVEKDASPMKLLSSSVRHVSLRLMQLKPKDVVVVVEPNDEFRRVIAGALSGFGLFVEDFRSPVNAFQSIRARQSEDRPVILITDIAFQEHSADDMKRDGFDLLRKVKEHYPHIPVIVTGLMTGAEIRIRALFWGAHCFIQKQDAEPIMETLSSSEITLFTEELFYSIWNIIKTREILIEREHMTSLEQEMIDTIIEDFNEVVENKETLFSSRILVADDENEIRTVIRKYLAMDGYENVDEATDGRMAIDLFTQKRHDLVIIDLLMPEASGIQVLSHVKSISPRTQVIIVTGNADKNSAIMAVKLGAFDYLEKPFKLDELSSSVSKALEKNAMLRRMS